MSSQSYQLLLLKINSKLQSRTQHNLEVINSFIT
ncbi:uncharacterized protein [Bactrocera oleae]|nr:uncharacterized protein LOC106624855 [Bactrocera oleae]